MSTPITPIPQLWEVLFTTISLDIRSSTLLCFPTPQKMVWDTMVSKDKVLTVMDLVEMAMEVLCDERAVQSRHDLCKPIKRYA